MARNFVAERATEMKNHPERPKERAARMVARRKMVKKVGAIPKGLQVEHKSGNPLDNRPANLKIVTAKANNFGRRGGSISQNKGK